MDLKAAQTIVRKSGLEPALPFLLIQGSQVLFANERLEKLLRPLDETFKTVEDLAQVWPFFDEFKSPPAFFDHLLGLLKSLKGAEQAPLYSEAFLKTYRIHCHEEGGVCVLVFELVRSGDLLEDAEARQVLFRTMSHEIRTAVMSMRGYMDMLRDKIGDQIESKSEFEGIQNSMVRLDKVVRRLDDFKTELKVNLEEANAKGAPSKGVKGKKRG